VLAKPRDFSCSKAILTQLLGGTGNLGLRRAQNSTSAMLANKIRGHSMLMNNVPLASCWGGAVQAGYLSLMECDVDKGQGSGRADLWIAAGSLQYWFEFKRSAFNPFSSRWGLEHAFVQVKRDIEQLYFDDGEVGVACVISSTDQMSPMYQKSYDIFCSKVDYAVRFGPRSNEGVIIYFKILEV
jgi:hypothetical protein